MIGEPRVLLFDAVPPQLLLLARLLWHPEEAAAALSLVDESKLLGPPRYCARPLFELLTAEDREEDVVAFLRRVRAEHPKLYPVLDNAATVSHVLYDAVTMGDLADAIAWTRLDRLRRLGMREGRELSERYPALARWRDQVLANPDRRRPLERAAAWEFTALECSAAGRPREAARARRFAKGAVLKKVV